MKHVSFTTELQQKITEDHNLIVRTLYQPLIGTIPTALYQLLVDFNKLQWSIQGSTFAFREIARTLSINNQEMKVALDKLGAAGLVRHWSSSDGVTSIIKINAPLEPLAFKDSLLFKYTNNQITDLEFERIAFAIKGTRLLSKDGYQEQTAKFQNVFGTREYNNQENTLDIPTEAPQSIEAAIRGLPAAAFVKYITGKKISPSQLSQIQFMTSSGFSSISINLLVKYSFDVNGKVVMSYINKIALDLLQKGVSGADEIKLELDQALKNRTSTSITKHVINVAEEDDTTELSWDDVFDEMGDL